MFVTTAVRGAWDDASDSHCQLESSRTTTSRGLTFGGNVSGEMRMFPPSQTFIPDALTIAATSELVVLLPRVPVTAMTRFGQRSRNSATSDVTGMPSRRASVSSFEDGRTRGFATM